MAGASELKLNYFRKMFTLVEQAEPVVGKKKVDRYTTPFLCLGVVEGLQTFSPSPPSPARAEVLLEICFSASLFSAQIN